MEKIKKILNKLKKISGTTWDDIGLGEPKVGEMVEHVESGVIFEIVQVYDKGVFIDATMQEIKELEEGSYNDYGDYSKDYAVDIPASEFRDGVWKGADTGELI